jgi:hypothetical protein
VIQPNADQSRKAEQDLEETEAYLWENVLTNERAWPEHYREAAHRLDAILAKHLDEDGQEEVLDAAVQLLGAAETVAIRIGFSLGRTWTAYGELTEADACRAVEEAGGNAARVFVEVVERELLGIVPQ